MSRRKASRKLDDFFLLTGLGIARESVTLFLQYSSYFACIALFLLSPASAAVILSHAYLDRFLVAKLALRIQTVFDYGGGLNILAHNQYFTELFYHKLSETILSYVLCFPFLATFSLWARAAVAHTVADTYAGHRPSWHSAWWRLISGCAC